MWTSYAVKIRITASSQVLSCGTSLTIHSIANKAQPEFATAETLAEAGNRAGLLQKCCYSPCELPETKHPACKNLQRQKKSVKRLYFLTCHCIAQAFRGRSFYEPFSGYPSTSRLTRNKHGSPPSPGCAKSLCDLTSSSQINCSPILTPAFRRCIGCWKIRMHSEPET